MDAALWSIRYVGIEDSYLSFVFTDSRRIEQLARKHNGKLRITDSQHAYWPLRVPTQTPNQATKPSSPVKYGKQPPVQIPETDAQIVAKADLLAVLRMVLSPQTLSS